MWHVMHDEYFFTWPPSPQLAFTVFPYVRSVYYNLWNEFVYPYEAKLNRQILGLPQPEEAPNANRRNANNDNNNNRRGERNGEGLIASFLQTIIDILDTDDDNDDDHGIEELEADNVGNQGPAVEVVIEEGQGNQDNGAQVEIELVVEGGVEWEEPAPENQGAANPDVPPEVQGEDGNQHEVPPARAVRRPSLGSILSSMSNNITGSLLLPGISFAMGEALRLLLPAAWTAAPALGLYRYGPMGRPGLLHQRWGRSLVGGCLFVVMKDALRLYVRYRKATALAQRKVKNVDKRRLERR